ncbi:hypothetical protein ACOMDM_04585 [Serratia plymuthica]|jgi:hypothetical protein|uniref:hypothetical protein n=1 Tax=Serratia plymuthica TaxID=82996 RepID=UPI003B9F6B11
MKVIDSSMLDQISGGRGNNGGDRIDNNGRANSAGKTAATGAAVIVGATLEPSSPVLEHLWGPPLAAGSVVLSPMLVIMQR